MTTETNSRLESGEASATISIAMATYNGGRYIAEQLKSLANQTHFPVELVITDDGSTDDTEAVVRAFSETAPFPVRFERNPQRLGYANNFLKAASLCTGDYIAYCDQDDIWVEHKLAQCITTLQAEGSLLVNHTLRVCDIEMTPVDLLTQGILKNHTSPPLTAFAFLGIGYGNSIVFARWLLDLVSPDLRPPIKRQNRQCDHDQWAYLLASVFGSVSHVADPLVLYRRHTGNTSTPPITGLLGKLRAFLSAPLDDYLMRADFFDDCAEMFETHEQAFPEAYRARVSAAARVYRSRSALFRSRAAFYQTASVGRRAALFITLLKGGAYALERLGPASLAKDAIIGLGRVGRIVDTPQGATTG